MGVVMSRRKLVKRLVPILLVLILLGTVFAPCVSSDTKQPQKKTLTIWMQNNNDDYFNKLEVEQQQIDEIETSFNGLMTLVEDAMNNDIRGSNGENISKEEWGDIKSSTYGFISLIREIIGVGFPF